ncbi:MAG: helix-turn-helix domain-containing protein [Treponema sp.]|nr:helix-turn-helix domain-containing protein [Treponema sp.]
MAELDWDKEAKGEQQVRVAMAYLKNIMEEVFRDLGQGYGAELDRDLYFLLHSSRHLPIEEIKIPLDQVRSHMAGSFSCRMTVGIGLARERLEDIPQSLEEARESLRYRIIRGSGYDIFYGELETDPRRNIEFLTEVRGRLEEALKEGDFPSVSAGVLTLEEKLNAGGADPGIVPYAIWNLYLAIQPSLERLKVREDIQNRMESLLQDRELPFPEIRDRYLAFCWELCENTNRQRSDHCKALLTDIQNYIDRNLDDRNLTLDGIARALGMTASYLTRLYRTQTGLPLMKRVDSIRMERAKTLLRTGGDLDSILSACGYVDKNNFCRKFKRLEGISPMQYRKLAREQVPHSPDSPGVGGAAM